MNDYKGLIGELKEQCPAMDYDCCELAFRAADAIEQLVKERNAAVADLHLVANNCFEDYVFSACRCCKKNDTCNGQPATGCDFEWRGVQEANDGTEID